MDDAVTVMLVGLDAAFADELADDERFVVRSADDVDQVERAASTSTRSSWRWTGKGRSSCSNRCASKAPEAAVVVVTEAEHEADGAVAMHAGAEDHLVRRLDPARAAASRPCGTRCRSVGCAESSRRPTRSPDCRTCAGSCPSPSTTCAWPTGAGPRWCSCSCASRARSPTDDVREAAEVLLDAVRDADLPARITDDTFAVLLTGDAAGAETLVLSRLVEAIAVHNAKQDPPRPLSLVGRQRPVRTRDAEHAVADPRDGRTAAARSRGGLIHPVRLELRIPSRRRARSVEGAVVAGDADAGSERVDGRG